MDNSVNRGDIDGKHCEEHELWSRYQLGDAQAETALLLRYHPLVEMLATRLMRRLPVHVRRDDIVAAGREGLWRAIQSFDRQMATPFEHFAQARIRGSMLDELRRMDEQTRTQRHQHKQAQSTYSAQQQVAGYSTVSLDQNHSLEWLVDDAVKSPEELALQSSLVSDLNRAIIKLSEQEQLVLSLVFMEGLNLTETAEVMSLSRGRINQIYSGAIKSLRGSFLRAQRLTK